MLKEEDLREIEKLGFGQKVAICFIAALESQGEELTQEDMDKWRADKKSLKSLMSLASWKKASGMSSEQADLLYTQISKMEKDAFITNFDGVRVLLPATEVQVGAFYIDKTTLATTQPPLHPSTPATWNDPEPNIGLVP